MANINIYGSLWAATADGKIAFAEQIYDNDLGKFQSEINKLVVGDDEQPGSSLPEQIAALEDKIDEHIAQKNQPNGYAGLDENGKIPVSLLNGQLASVQGVDAVATSTTLPSDSLVEDYMVWCTDDLKFREWNAVTSAWEVIDPKTDTIYNFRNSDATGSTGRTNILYRWDGAALTEISASLSIGTVAGTAYDGAQGAANRAAIQSLPASLLVSLGTVTPAADGITIAYKDAAKQADSMNFAAAADKSLKLPNAVAKVGDGSTTPGAAGLMSPTDKANLDALVQMAGGTPDSGDGSGTPITPDTADYLKKSDAGVGVVKTYTKASTKEAIAAGDTIAVALGKLEFGIDGIFGGDGATGGDITIPDIPEPDGTDVPVIDEPTNETVGSDITPDQLPEDGDDLKTIIAKQNQLIEILNKKIKLLNALVQPENYQLVYVEADGAGA